MVCRSGSQRRGRVAGIFAATARLSVAAGHLTSPITAADAESLAQIPCERQAFPGSTLAAENLIAKHPPDNTRMLQLAGVPEHFNLPWHLAIESGDLGQSELGVHWTDYTTGTGAMLADLADGRLDLAVLLTEGAALGLARGLPFEAVSLYTTSPLIWGVHVATGSRLGAVSDLETARFGISRYGSGSHLMSLALAIGQGWDVDRLEFEIVDDLPGAIAALAAGRADIFLWERFTTEPAVAAGHFHRIDEFVSPWPAWVICAGSEPLATHRSSILALIDTVARQAARLAAAEDAAELIASRYALRPASVARWLERTRWVDGLMPPDEALDAATRMLVRARAIPPGTPDGRG